MTSKQSVGYMVPVEQIEGSISEIRGKKVMLDADLAALYGVATKRMNEQVRRNAARFPEDFMFQLTAEEYAALRSQFATSNVTSTQESQVVTPKTSRSSIGVEIDRAYCQMALRRLERETRSFFSGVEVSFTTAAEMGLCPTIRPERVAVVFDAPSRRRIRKD